MPVERYQGPGAAVLVTIASIVLLFGFQLASLLGYVGWSVIAKGHMPNLAEPSLPMTIIAIASTFPAHLVTLGLCLMVLTAGWRRPLFSSPLWQWHVQFKWVHAVALALLMIGIAALLERLLPHRETDLERLLRLGPSVRYLVAALAVLTAPLVEELVYRGVLYGGIERRFGRWKAVAIATATFALIHVLQYWGSFAAITAIFLLSLVLTLLRALTGKLLPCIATHLVYNGIQAIALIFGGENLFRQASEKAAAAVSGLPMSLLTNSVLAESPAARLVASLAAGISW